MEQSNARLQVLKKIEDYERQGLFDIDAEEDPPTRTLCKGEVDYLGTKLTSKVKTFVANRLAVHHFDKCIAKNQLVIKEIRGIENYLNLNGGAIITSNHFHPFDNYAIYKAIQPHLDGHRLYKIIREGNYSNFPGLYGFFFRNCNTLPLSSNLSVMKDMITAVNTLLSRGEKILIYPEQSMWWNYRKPRPLKPGAFQFAVKANVPVLPVFIAMEDTENLDAEGFPIQAYTICFWPAIYPDSTITGREAQDKMCKENYLLWKKSYESFYGIPLTYTTEGKEVSYCSI